MHSFAAFSFLATLACAAFTAAAPVDLPLSPDTLVGAVPALPIPAVPVLGNVASVGKRDLLPALPIPAISKTVALPRDNVRPLEIILADVTAKISPLLTALVAAEVTVDALTPIVANIKVVLNGAIVEIKGLVGHPITVILATANGVLTIPQLAHLVAGVVVLVYTALGAVFKVAIVAKANVVIPLLADVGVLVGDLIAAILVLVADLLVVLLPLLGDVVGIIINLNLKAVISILGIHV